MRALPLLALAATLAGCRSPTEIRVEVSTDVPCASWKGAAVAVGELGASLESALPSTSTTACDATGHVGTVVVLPSGSDGAEVAFRIVGAVERGLEACTVDAGYAGCVVARRALRFIPHESLSLAVPLLAACKDVPCDPTSTCVQGVCKPATIPDPSACASQTCGEGSLGPGASDAGVDATVGGDGGGDAGGDGGGGGPEAGLDGAGIVDAEAGGPVGDAQAACAAGSCALALGQYFSCVLREGGVECWGQNDLGELGNGLGDTTDPPMAVMSGTGALSGVAGVVAGQDTACAVLADAAVSCWGAGSPLGVDASPGLIQATPIPSLGGAPLLSIGDYHMCWASASGVLKCEDGENQEPNAYGSVSGGGAMPVTLAAPAGVAPPFDQLGTTQFFTCLRSGSSVYCLGDNGSNESNPGGPGGTLSTFTKVPGPASTIDVQLMSLAACARTASGVFCWGDGAYSENGAPNELTVNEVRYADGGSIAGAVQLAAGEFHSCARLAGGEVACWGNNQEHQLGRGGIATGDGGTSYAAALVVDADGGVFQGAAFVAGGGYHTCAIKTDGTLWCWGDNSYGQTAPGDLAQRSVPTQVKY